MYWLVYLRKNVSVQENISLKRKKLFLLQIFISHSQTVMF